MRILKYVALLAVLMVPLAYSQAQVRVGVGIGYGPTYVAGPPVCAYGYYGYYPYRCAPYGFYGSDWFVNGVFIGAGPWYHGYWHHGWYGRPSYWYSRGWYGRPGWRGGYGFYNRGYVHGYARGFHGRGRW